jgi:hypothetical protein
MGIRNTGTTGGAGKLKSKLVGAGGRKRQALVTCKLSEKWADPILLQEGFVEPLGPCSVCLWARWRAASASSDCVMLPKEAASTSAYCQRGTRGKSARHISRSETV